MGEKTVLILGELHILNQVISGNYQAKSALCWILRAAQILLPWLTIS